jgi:hypothetical protein
MPERGQLGFDGRTFISTSETPINNAIATSFLLSSSSSHQSRPCCDILSRLYFACHNGAQKLSDEVIMIQCLKDMLAITGLQPIYIIMDAFDECPNWPGIPSPREQVLALVKELVDFHLLDLNICVTSRPEFNIRATLAPLAHHCVSLHNESRQIRFRWVFCQLETLRQCLPSSVQLTLEELPESLDETYKLKDIRKSNIAQAYRLLQCLAVAIRPLSVAELAELLVFDFTTAKGRIPELNTNWRWEDHEQAILSTCSSSITIVGSGGSWSELFRVR